MNKKEFDPNEYLNGDFGEVSGLPRPKSAKPKRDDLSGLYSGGMKLKGAKLILIGMTVDESTTDDIDPNAVAVVNSKSNTNKKKKETIEKLYLEGHEDESISDDDSVEDENLIIEPIIDTKPRSMLTVRQFRDSQSDDIFSTEAKNSQAKKSAKKQVRINVMENQTYRPDDDDDDDNGSNEANNNGYGDNDDNEKEYSEVEQQRKNNRILENSYLYKLLNNQSKSDFVLEPAPAGAVVQCKVIRRKNQSECKMMLEINSSTFVDIMVARKKTSYYIIYVYATEGNDIIEVPIARVKANLLGTQFTICGMGKKPNTARDKNDNDYDASDLRIEYISIIYELNILGLKGPRQMTVIIPGMDSQCNRKEVIPKSEDETILSTWSKLQKQNAAKDDSNNNVDKTKSALNLITLYNKKPIWNDELKCHTLVFNQRVTMTSVKNFQIIHPSKPDYVTMQFGRTEKNEFTCDYGYPLCALQAFGVALSSLDSKIGCE